MSISVVDHRRALHRIPEIGLELPKTCAYVEQALKQYQCTVFRPIPSSVCAFFDAGKDHAMAFRADMDALPIPETSEAEYISCHPGNMHACGHDGHTAMVLALAEYVDGALSTLPHNVLLIFQPDEEGDGGAKQILDTGLFETYNVKNVFGCHLWPNIPKGEVQTKPGPMMARTNEIDVVITGKSVHMSRSQEGLDAMAAGVEFLRRSYALVEALPDLVRRKFHYGRMISGTVRNAVSANTLLEASLRTYDDETYNHCTQGLHRIAKELEEETGCGIEISISSGYLAVWNDEELLASVCQQLGEDAPGLLGEPALAAEDFSFYQRKAPGVFFFLGTGNTPELHAVDFDFDDESILPTGVAFFKKLLYLNEY